MLRHLKALLILAAFAVPGILGTPGLDFQKWREFDAPDEQARARAQLGPLWGEVAIAIATFNGKVRHPVYTRIEGIQPPFRARQSWHLYRDGPSKVRRLEILVDGQLVHRSADPTYRWRDAQMRNRHMRPVLENVARKRDTPNWRGVMRWIVAEVRKDWPEAQVVKVVATSSPFPGTQPTESHFYLARAPEWVPRQDGKKK